MSKTASMFDDVFEVVYNHQLENKIEELNKEIENLHKLIEGRLNYSEWATLKGLRKRHCEDWSLQTYRRRVTEMKNTPEFKKYVQSPTGRTTIVNYEKFKEYLDYMEERKFR